MTYDPHAGGEPHDPHNYGGYPLPAYPYGGYAPPPPSRPRRARWRFGAGLVALTAAALAAGFALGEARSRSVEGSGSVAQQPVSPGNGGLLPGGGRVVPGGGSVPGSAPPGNGPVSVPIATRAQQTGVVTIVAALAYQNTDSVATGMILTATGEVLTNNHVIDGATGIKVTVVATGKTYRAEVVGTAPSEDVALLQLRNASGLGTAKLGNSARVSAGASVVGVGNACGTGTLRAATGSITGLGKTITATDESGQNPERLHGLIQTNAPIVSGDSGGPLYDSAGAIVGMDTAEAATAAAAMCQPSTAAYAIPISSALTVAAQIERGAASTTIHLGRPAFLGVEVAAAGTTGARVTALLPGGPAAHAGISEGSVITAVNRTKITSAASLKTALGRYRPGQQAKISWIDAAGARHTATVTLASGPAD